MPLYQIDLKIQEILFPNSASLSKEAKYSSTIESVHIMQDQNVMSSEIIYRLYNETKTRRPQSKKRFKSNITMASLTVRYHFEHELEPDAIEGYLRKYLSDVMNVCQLFNNIEPARDKLMNYLETIFNKLYSEPENISPQPRRFLR